MKSVLEEHREVVAGWAARSQVIRVAEAIVWGWHVARWRRANTAALSR